MVDLSNELTGCINQPDRVALHTRGRMGGEWVDNEVPIICHPCAVKWNSDLSAAFNRNLKILVIFYTAYYVEPSHDPAVLYPVRGVHLAKCDLAR